MIWLLGGIACLVVWVVFTFLMPVGLGLIHVLLGAGILLVIRGWVAVDARRVMR